MAREVEHLLGLVLRAGVTAGPVDLEAVEMAVRCSMHQAGAAVLSQLLQFDPPSSEQRQLPCQCGHSARYVELRSKPVLTAVGSAECVRPYYLCEHCHGGQFPVDVELDLENTELSPGVRRMLAAVGQEGPFAQGRQQMELLAGLSVTTQSRRTHGRSHRRRYRSWSTARAQASPATGVADPAGATHSHSICGDGWHRHSGGTQGE